MSARGEPYTVTADDGVVLHGEVHGADGPSVVLLHGGGDRVSLRPTASLLAAEGCRVLLPDVRGYGRSICRDPRAHTWARYVADLGLVVVAHGAAPCVVVGAGLGSTIALRAARDEPGLAGAAFLISPEDIEDDVAKQAETELMDRFARTIAAQGLDVAWNLYLPDLQPLIGAIVRDALPRTDPQSAAAAASIGHDRAFVDVRDLAAIGCPVAVMAGDDARHPAALAARIVRAVPRGRLTRATFGAGLKTVDDLADAVVPELLTFIQEYGLG